MKISSYSGSNLFYFIFSSLILTGGCDILRNTCNNDDNLLTCSLKPKRYILYEINPGEGFNLRRDIFIRIAPLVKELNEISSHFQWILVLPPWGNLPHWTATQINIYFPWSNYFQLNKINDYIPAIELKQYLEDYGFDNPIDVVFRLQHFPFDSADSSWSEKMEIAPNCENMHKFKRNKIDGLLSANFWNEKIYAKSAFCASLRGYASTITKFLAETNYSSIMFDRAEVILWENYGGESWWEARQSLVFSQNLHTIAQKYLENVFETLYELNYVRKSLNEYKNKSENYLTEEKFENVKGLMLGAHLRRQDLFQYRKNYLPSIGGAALQMIQIMKRLKLKIAFLATDSSDEDFSEFLIEFNSINNGQNLGFILLHLRSLENENSAHLLNLIGNLTEGELAILDQIICSWSSYFIGTPDSTFSLRIFEEREILRKDPESTFNYFCPDRPWDEEFAEIPDCKQPVKWKLVKSKSKE